MDSYNQLLQQIKNNAALQQNLEKMVNDYKDDTLILTCNDWKSRLENDKVFQDIQHNPKLLFRKLTNQNTSTMNLNYEVLKADFNILMVGVCRFAKPYKDQESHKMAIIVTESLPLIEIASAVTSDLGPIHVSDEYKFNFNNCSISTCSNCKDASNVCKDKGIIIKKIHQPCICDTKIFDGKYVLNMFASEMEQSFPQSFLAMLKLKIENRYDFNGPDNIRIYRVGGKVLDIVGFPESKLLPLKQINMGLSFKTLDDLEIPCDGLEVPGRDNGLEVPGRDNGLEVPGEKRKLKEDLTEAIPDGYKKQREDFTYHEESNLLI